MKKLAARDESLAAFDERCIPPGGVAPPSNTPGILRCRALPAGRLVRLGATRGFHHGLLVASLLLGVILAGVLPAAAAEDKPGSLSALSTQPSMNVFRRFAGDRAKMVEFYGDVLGLKQLPSFNLGGGNEMVLFSIGSGQVKLQATPAASQYPAGAVRDVTGLRVFTFFYPDEAALTARFTAKGYPAPVFVVRKAG